MAEKPIGRRVTYVPTRGKKGVVQVTAWGPADMVLPPNRRIIEDVWMFASDPDALRPDVGNRRFLPLALPTYDPDRDVPGRMEHRGELRDGDYCKAEDVRRIVAALRDALQVVCDFQAEHYGDAIDTHVGLIALTARFRALLERTQ